MYYNYHGIIRQLISEGHLIGYEFVEKWNSITNALVLFFDNHRPTPIRKHRWNEYKDVWEEVRI